MRKTIWFLLALLIAGAAGTGCDSDIDPDTLVRELRILALRFGDPAPGSTAELQATVDLLRQDLVFTDPSIHMAVLTGAPTGPGRRVPTSGGPRARRYDWFVCIGPLSLFSPGTLDPGCLKFKPGDPPPRQNSALVPLVLENMAPTDGTLTVPTDALKEILGRFVQALLSGGGGQGGGGGGGFSMLAERPIVILLPIMVRVSVPPPPDGDGDPNNPLDSEIGYNFLRITIALPGMLPPPNHNPFFAAEGGVFAAVAPAEQLPPMTRLVPCPEGVSCPSYGVSRDASIFFTGRAEPASVETYTPLDDSGRQGIAEVLRYAWFSTDGVFEAQRTGDHIPETEWKNFGDRPAPLETSVVDLWIVVQDERTGCDYQHFQVGFP
jgi:hypothetical protein